MSRIEKVIEDAQNRQAVDAANKELFDLEEWAGGPMRRINEKHHDATSRGNWWITVLGPLGIVVVLVVLILTAAMLGELAGGWPA